MTKMSVSKAEDAAKNHAIRRLLLFQRLQNASLVAVDFDCTEEEFVEAARLAYKGTADMIAADEARIFARMDAAGEVE
jgi:hypothetical protein